MSNTTLSSKAIQWLNGLQAEYYKTEHQTLLDLGLLGRIKLYDWSLEFIGLGVIAGLVLLFTLGDYINKSSVQNWLKAVHPVLEENFYQVGVNSDDLYIKDDCQSYTSYATGRINIKNLTAKFHLIGRQNLFMHIFELILSNFFESVSKPEDVVEIVVKPHDADKLNKFIFAVVNKEGMNQARSDNYYLSLTKTTESEELPVNFVFMSESNELNKDFLTAELKEVLAQSSSVLKYLAITDLPVEHPVTEAEFVSSPRLIMKLNLRTDSKALEASKNLIDQVIQLTDRLVKYKFKGEQQRKIAAVRTNELAKIKKAIQDSKAEELKELKLEAEREARRASKLSPEEQDKLDKKMKEKRERRAKNRQVKRM